jgi:hypothetical protein
VVVSVHSRRFIHSSSIAPIAAAVCGKTIASMNPDLERLLGEQRGVATSGQILDRVTRYAFDRMVDVGTMERLWQGIYCVGEPTVELKLSGLDLACGTTVAVCLGTAAAFTASTRRIPRCFTSSIRRDISCGPLKG